jgi:hypothetical protein
MSLTPDHNLLVRAAERGDGKPKCRLSEVSFIRPLRRTGIRPSGEERDQMDAAVTLFVRAQCGASSLARTGLQLANFMRTPALPEGRGQIDGSEVVLDIGHRGSAGRTMPSADRFPETRQNASVAAVSRVHLGNLS